MSTADFVSFVQKFAELARILLHGAFRQPRQQSRMPVTATKRDDFKKLFCKPTFNILVFVKFNDYATHYTL